MRSNYRDTLNLPQTDFPMQANLAGREPGVLDRWATSDLYGQIAAGQSGKPPFWLVDGPPYANGDIHIGHALNKILKDIVLKSRRLDGLDARMLPGWDCHGLPIELKVEKELGPIGERHSPEAFRLACRTYAQEQVERQRRDFKRLGVLADWDHPYLTMQPAFEAEQLRALARIIENGHVVRGHKPVHWCVDCGSSLAEAEVEHREKTSTALDVGFRITDHDIAEATFGASDACGAMLVCWTTTPWSLPANVAVCVSAGLEYVLARIGERKLVVADTLLQACAKRYDTASFEVLGRASGQALTKLELWHPYEHRKVSVVLGNHVQCDAGTGLVHLAPAHGFEDYEVGQQYGLPVCGPLQDDGRFHPATPIVGSVPVREADSVVLEALRAQGTMVHVEPVQHSYPHCWRHKTPLLFRATPQWFISMDGNGLRQQALRAITKTLWRPVWGEDRIRSMVASRPDWCISRQRAWGVPMAVFTKRDTGALHPETPNLLRRVADEVEQSGLEAWFSTDAAYWLGAGTNDYIKSTDTLDVWFDSGLVQQAGFVSAGLIPRGKMAPQADLYLEGSDQHRGWFQSSLLLGVAVYGRAPYKQVITHGFTVDEHGRKMSKSLGNVVAPQEVIQEFGADVLRLWVASGDYSGEIAVSKSLLKQVADAYRRIRNSARYLLGSLHEFDPARDQVEPGQLLSVDAWAISVAADLQTRLKEAYGAAEFHTVYQLLHNYCSADLGALYLDILKDRLYTLRKKAPGRRSAQTAVYHILEGLVRWIAPILSFTADEIWRLMPGDRNASVLAHAWHTFPNVPAPGLDFDVLTKARAAVKKELERLRVAGEIGAGLEAEVVIYPDNAAFDTLATAAAELRFWFTTSVVEVRPPEQAPGHTEGNGSFSLHVVRSSHPKCERCWNHAEDVGSYIDYPLICGRCALNLDGHGEQRRHF